MKGYRLFVFMGDGEYQANTPMDQVAKEAAQQHKDKRPLLVMVTEHGGWWLQYWFDGTRRDGMIVGTANDAAKLNAGQEAIRNECRAMLKWEQLPEIRRPNRV